MLFYWQRMIFWKSVGCPSMEMLGNLMALSIRKSFNEDRQEKQMELLTCR